MAILRHTYPSLDPMSLTFGRWVSYLDAAIDIRDMNRDGCMRPERTAQRMARKQR